MVSVALMLQRAIINHVNAQNESTIIKAELTLFLFPSSLHFKGYVEMSVCSVKEAAIVTEYVYIHEYTVVNFTANDFGILLENILNEEHFSETLTPMMLAPCIFQYYTRKRGYLDARFQTGSRLNFSVFFISNNIKMLSDSRYSISHCGWAEESAFLHIRASVIIFTTLMIFLSMIKFVKRSVSVTTKPGQIMIVIMKILVLIIQVKLLHYILSQC